ncbi:MAG: OmpA family protein [Thiolinea sp.]
MSVVKANPNRLPLRLILLATLLAAGLGTLTAYWKKNAIETDLTQAVHKALDLAGLPLINVNFEGRAATLSGSVSDEALANQINETVQQVYGVRQVQNQLSALPEEQATETLYETASVPAEFENGLYVPNKQHPLEKYNLDQVQFVYAESTLQDSAYPVLDKLAQLLKQNPQIHIEIGVHTDNSGTALGQIGSTTARANAVREYLLGQEVQPEQVKHGCSCAASPQ